MGQRFKVTKERWLDLLNMAWPLIIANSFWNIQLTIDRVFLGQYSTEALGAAMAVMGVFWTPMALLQQTAAYLMTFVAQYLGAKEKKNIGPAVWQSIYISIVGGLLFLLLIFAAPSFFGSMGHTEVITQFEIEYFQAICFSALPTALIAASSAFFSGLGVTRTVMWINCVGMIANIIFDYLLIFGNLGFPALGVEGAGIATVIASICGAIFSFALVFSSKHNRLYSIFSGWKPNMALLKRFLRFGLPSGLQWSLEGLAFTVFLIIIGAAKGGDAALAGSSIVVTLMMLSILPTLGIAQAVSIKLGQFLGENKPDRATVVVWTGFQISLLYIISVGLTFLAFPSFYLGWFENHSNAAIWQQVATMVPYLLMYVALFTCFDSINLVFSFALKGAGDTKFVSLVALMVPWPLMVLPTWLVKDWEGAVYWSWGAASIFGICQALIFLWRFMQGKWRSMSVIH